MKLSKPHWLCRVFGHQLVEVNSGRPTHYFICKRCGDYCSFEEYVVGVDHARKESPCEYSLKKEAEAKRRKNGK